MKKPGAGLRLWRQHIPQWETLRWQAVTDSCVVPRPYSSLIKKQSKIRGSCPLTARALRISQLTRNWLSWWLKSTVMSELVTTKQRKNSCSTHFEVLSSLWWLSEEICANLVLFRAVITSVRSLSSGDGQLLVVWVLKCCTMGRRYLGTRGSKTNRTSRWIPQCDLAKFKFVCLTFAKTKHSPPYISFPHLDLFGFLPV